jgi:hypothetical protein
MPYAILDENDYVINCMRDEQAGSVEVSAAEALMMSGEGRFDVWRYVNGTIVIDPTRLAAAHRQGMTCGPLELRRALRSTGDYDAVIGLVAEADIDVQEAWEYATVIKRLDPFVLAVQTALGKTDAEVDALFNLAKTLG